MSIEIRVPALGESVTEATVGKWFKNSGDAVNADEPLVELETDKVTLEVPAPASGVLGDILVRIRIDGRSRRAACRFERRRCQGPARKERSEGTTDSSSAAGSGTCCSGGR